MEHTTEPAATAYPAGSLAETYGLGLTKREYFAAMALQGLLASGEDCSAGKSPFSVYTAAAVRYADALIEALNEKSDRT